MSDPVGVFISYSWDSEAHKIWVRDLAARLRQDGIDVKLDQWDVQLGDPLPEFMEKSIEQSDFVLIVCTPGYKRKSSSKSGGVGYEGDIISSELFVKRNHEKYIPVLRDGDWSSAVPISIQGKAGVDLAGSPYSEEEYQRLLEGLKGNHPEAPPLGAPPLSHTGGDSQPGEIPKVTQKEGGEWQDIVLKGIILEDVTTPRMDGSSGSALYSVPFQISRPAPADWAKLFIHHWKYPPIATTMHRPDVAYVAKDRIYLNGTTIEEVEQYHLSTLKRVIRETNKQVRDHRIKQQQRADRKKKAADDHRNHLSDIANRLDFDDE